jgi:PadR family transcriptional regulator PadR
MYRNFLGEFEELILLTVALLNGEGYGARIVEELAGQTGRKAALSAVHISLYRLEDKGLVRSHLGGAVPERGGRSKRFYTITTDGMETLRSMRDVRQSLWKLIPSM